MKIMEFSEFIEQAKKVEPEKKLVFLSYVDTETGTVSCAEGSPEIFNNVLHVGGNMYLAWDDPDIVRCYIGKYQ